MTPRSLLFRAFGTAALLAAFVSCSENLDSSGACPVLCPQVGGDVQNVTIDAVVLDTTVEALSGLGNENGLFLASRGDTLDTRVIIRYDSLPQKFTPAGDTAQPITTVDSAYIQFMLDTVSIKGAGPVTIEAYDVDTTANDTSAAAVLALFRPDRLISSQTFARTDLTDSLKYFISNATVLSKIQSASRLRIGLRATSSESFQARFFSTEAGFPPLLTFRATPDTATARQIVNPLSSTPADEKLAAAHLGDYTLIAKAPPPAAQTDLAVGGLPPRRVYMRFDIPASIIDSSTVVRATLLLNQIPTALLDPTDTVRILPGLVLAGKAVKDPAKAAEIATDIALDTVFVQPGGSGLTQVELARAFAVWRTQSPDTTARAIVLRSLTEGLSPLEIAFSSSEAVTALRPRLRISFVKRVPLGLP
ncbi:MAG: hypothetical protein ACRENK_16795 [Gemmatimonadaceae bacterium]